MIVNLFLALSFFILEGRCHVVLGDQIIVVANHRVIREKITKDVDMPGARRSTYEYLQVLGHYGGVVSDRDDIVVIVRLYYLDFKIVRLEFQSRDR